MSITPPVPKIAKVPNKKLYRVRFLNEGRIFELYAREVGQGLLFGFVEIADLVWGSKSEVIRHGSHCPQMDLPELVNDKIEKFLREMAAHICGE